MPAWAMPLIQMAVGMLAPFITAFLEQLAGKLGVPLSGSAMANATKPVINTASGAMLATLFTGNMIDPALPMTLGALGAMAGNRVREAMNKTAKPS